MKIHAKPSNVCELLSSRASGQNCNQILNIASDRNGCRKAGLTKQQAIDALRTIEYEALNDRNGVPTTRTSDVAIRELFKDYLASLSQRTGTEHVRHIKKDLTAFLDEAHVRVFRDITPAAVETSLARLADRNLSTTSINMRLVVELARAGAFSSSDILPVIQEFENPHHEEFREKNAWNLYQSCTEIMKSQLPSRQVDGFRALNHVLTAELN